MGITVRGGRAGAAAARAWKRTQGTTIGSRDKSGARGTGSGVGGTITPYDYAEKHAAGFGTTRPESLSQGLSNVYGGSVGTIRDAKTGAIVVYDANEDEALLIEPAGGLTEAERKEIMRSVDIQGDIPNIGESIEDNSTERPSAQTGGGWNIFAPTFVPTIEGSYEEGDIETSSGAGGGGGIGGSMLLVVGVVLVVAIILFGGRK